MKRKISILFLLALIFLLSSCGETESQTEIPTPEPTPTPEPETVVVSGEGQGFAGSIVANLIIEGNQLVSVELIGESETKGIGALALPELQEAILRAGGTKGVDVVSGATFTSKGVFEAVNNAIGDRTLVGTSATSGNQTSTFTNKYGTATTRCAHSGCTNYIASSGDTNCCTVHSNKCLNCGKYIDEDAMYCMDCISGAMKK